MAHCEVGELGGSTRLDERRRDRLSDPAFGVVVLGDDQREIFQDDCRPAIGIYYGETIRNAAAFNTALRDGGVSSTIRSYLPSLAKSCSASAAVYSCMPATSSPTCSITPGVFRV